ncbi:serine/threonine-protein kinase pakD-like isoform X2 [Cotesia glomerata]|uniref:serine/threonine-protein kinase pakD-like isoform X2 n=1 Tax=Cotesia glomerata TaxID=32391 RepID=UPI001D0143E9|nr:serine/threonine-protein kinase pakD-like isoform X2 [Cotesia glomerata]
MEYALIEIPSLKKKCVVETTKIKDFGQYNSLSKGKIYSYCEGGQIFKCIILKTADTEEEMNDSSKRIRRPKYNKSSLSDDTDEEDSQVAMMKQKRKFQATSKLSAKKQRSDDILRAYNIQRQKNSEGMRNKARESSEEHEESSDKENEQVRKVFEKENIEDRRNQESNVVTEEYENNNPEVIGETVNNNDDRIIYVDAEIHETEPAISKSLEIPPSDTPTIRQQENLNGDSETVMLTDVLKKNRQQANEIKKLTRKLQQYQRQSFIDRQERHQQQQNEQDQQQHHLQQERHQQQHQQPQQQHQNRLQNGNDDLHQITNPIYIGGNTFISSLEHTEAFNAYKPAKFMKIMSHAIWTPEHLALRAVRVQKNNLDRLPLTPQKKVVLIHNYKKFLIKRNLSREMMDVEMRNFNEYLGAAITSARKKVL